MAKASDNVFPYVHVSPAAAPSSPSAGSQRLYLDSADGNKLKRKDSSGTVTTIEGGGATYTTYTPVVTADTTNPTLGTASVAEGYYAQMGKHVVGTIYIKLGTSGFAAGTGTWHISLPVNAATTGTIRVLGHGGFWDASAPTASGWITATRATTSTLTLIAGNATTAGAVAPLAPITWAASDEIWVNFSYEAA